MGIIPFNLPVKPDVNMPRSFLVKKYFSNKKPYYRESQLESQTGKFFSPLIESGASVIIFDILS